MTTTAICLFAAMLTTGLMIETDNSCKRSYIVLDRILSHHIAEAIGDRNLDRGDWAERGV